MSVQNYQVQIKDWIVSTCRTDVNDRLVVAATPRVMGETLCPACGSGALAPKGVTIGHHVDQPRLGRAVVIEATRERHKCDDCGHGFSTPMPAAMAGGRFTRDGYAYALEQSAVVPLEVLARTMGTSVSTLRHWIGVDAGPPAIIDVEQDDRVEELAVCPLCVRRFERSMAVVRTVPLGALPGRFRSRLPICPTCDDEGAPVSLCG